MKGWGWGIINKCKVNAKVSPGKYENNTHKQRKMTDRQTESSKMRVNQRKGKEIFWFPLREASRNLCKSHHFCVCENSQEIHMHFYYISL